MKKIFALFIAALSALALIGCGGEGSGTKDKSGPPATPTPVTLENYSGERPAVEIVIRDYGNKGRALSRHRADQRKELSGSCGPAFL